MTTRTSCCTLYLSHLDRSALHTSSSISGLGYEDPSGDVGPEDGNHSESSR